MTTAEASGAGARPFNREDPALAEPGAHRTSRAIRTLREYPAAPRRQNGEVSLRSLRHGDPTAQANISLTEFEIAADGDGHVHEANLPLVCDASTEPHRANWKRCSASGRP